MEINKELLDKLFEQAKENPRLRQNFDLRTSPADTSQRMLNALLPGTVVPIHRHVDTTETALSNKNTDYKKANKQRQKERKESFKEIKSSDNIFTREVKLEDLLMDGLNGQKVINPVSFSRIADAYAQLRFNKTQSCIYVSCC